MHLHVPRLPDAENPVGSLVLHRWIPPAVEMENVISPCQVKPRPAGLERQDENRRAVAVSLESLDHAVPLPSRHPAV